MLRYKTNISCEKIDLAMNVSRSIKRKPFHLPHRDPSLYWILIAFFVLQFFLFSPGGPQLLKKEPIFLSDTNNQPLIFTTTSYNWRGRRLNNPSALNYADYPDAPKLVIATLVSNHQVDVDKLCRGLGSLGHLKGDVKGFDTPVLVFNDGSLSNFQLEKIVQSTDRPIAFPLVNDLNSFPDGFTHPKIDEGGANLDPNSLWFYPKVTRFWVYSIWNHPAIAAFDFVMRMDFDTCFADDNNYLPDFEKEHKAYHAQYVGVEPNAEKVEGLYNFTIEYMTNENILPTNPLQWQLVTNIWTIRKTLPLYQVSLEVVRKSFMQHPDVMKFHNAVANQAPYGIFEYGWSDHVLRFIDTAMFVSNENFMTSEFKGFANRERCAAVSSSVVKEVVVEEEKSEEEKPLEEITIGSTNSEEESSGAENSENANIESVAMDNENQAVIEEKVEST